MKVTIDHEELLTHIEEAILTGLELGGWTCPGCDSPERLDHERRRLARERAGNVTQALYFDAELAAEIAADKPTP